MLGYCNMLWKLLRDMPPDNGPTHLAAIFDQSEKTFRTALYDRVQSQPSAAPDDLIPQFPLVREAMPPSAFPAWNCPASRPTT